MLEHILWLHSGVVPCFGMEIVPGKQSPAKTSLGPCVPLCSADLQGSSALRLCLVSPNEHTLSEHHP